MRMIRHERNDCWRWLATAALGAAVTAWNAAAAAGLPMPVIFSPGVVSGPIARADG
jgi:hypothetical protein